jgi:hypothetical protein
MSWQNDIYVTGANPPPGRTIPVDSGWGQSGSRDDGGVGLNVYIAGGVGPGGAVPVTGNLGVQIDMSGVSLSMSSDVHIAASVPLPISGVVAVSQTNPSNFSGTVQISGVVPIAGALPVTGNFATTVKGPSTGTPVIREYSSGTSQLLLSSNPSRVAFSIYNDSDQTYLVCLGSSASVDSWDFSLFPQGFYESPYPGYTGPVAGIGFGSGSGNIRVKEMVP